ncbi:MAG TPA: saccharopine dehydrogenase C-terminal domain-containing protein [Thermoanaerobaculia bacterium]|jgi:saccharopine dehydrogenase-like NADP-dependent oxidoreductase|nr:saccharopine dehydrogenase C-terminal domain-containing protein [Thermoanaerobaculia bacterium]
MTERYRIVIAGAGGMGQATGLLLRELGDFDVDLYLGDADAQKAREAAEWICHDSTRTGAVEPFHLPLEGSNAGFNTVLGDADLLLDCLPGEEATRMARLARDNRLHYANLTEYVKATNEITELARGAEQGFLLQTGLAPGYINVLGNGLFQRFCREHGVDKVDILEMRVGALTRTTRPPHQYGFTWNPKGVATEYVEPAVVVRDFRKTTRPSLSDRRIVLIDGHLYEEALTSGGAADLPAQFEGRVRNLDYKTFRYPGHYEWVLGLLDQMRSAGVPEEELSQQLLQRMLEVVPFVEDDLVVIYAAVEGRDSRGTLHRLESSRVIRPRKVGGHRLKAIQTTTSAGLAESARLLLRDRPQGVYVQSQIDPVRFMDGPFVSIIYG